MPKKKDLLIVESPTKAHTIGLLLKGKMKVLSSRGHIADLPKSRLGVDIEHGFEPEYIRIRGKAAVIKELRNAAQTAGTVYLGCDPDREGEAIAFSVANEIKTAAPVRRVLFYEITKKGLAEAFKAPAGIDENKVASHRARRVLDRLVGYLVSPLLWRIVKGGLSAGRVQTVALRLIVEREREISAFRPEEYWIVKAVFERSSGERFEALLDKVRGETPKLTGAAEVEKVRAACSRAGFVVEEVKTRERRRKPLPPFITATLQQDAAQRLGFPARRTMRLAQELFEGIRLADETAGLITYPRTDSFRVAADSVEETRQLIRKQFGEGFLPEKPRHYPDRKGTQGAHEAIRPTRLDLSPEKAREYLTTDQLRVYDLIYRRFVASQMCDSVYTLTDVSIAGDDCTFKASAIKCLFPGFEKMYGDSEKEKVLPALAKGEAVRLAEFLPEQKFTQPPARYSEATLIKRLETNGIGRPSTYAAIVSTLLERGYVERREGRFQPTELGALVYDIVVPRFANVFEVGFTAEMERELDSIEAGRKKWGEVVARFYAPFKEDLDKMKEGAADIREDLKTELDEKCPKCGSNLAERWGRYGKFTACSRYPDCDYVKRPPAKLLDEKCPQCGKPLAERKGRFGVFIACSGYPDCRFVRKTPRPEPTLLDEKCPKCGARLASREGRFGLFVACSTYPKCRYVKRDARSEPRILDEKCPDCGKPLAERTGRFGKFVGCTGYPQCRYIKKEQKNERPRRTGDRGDKGEVAD